MARPVPALLVLLALAAAVVAQRDCYGAMLEVMVQQAGEPEPLQKFYGYPGPFGAFSLGLLNDTATPPVPLALAAPLNACGTVAPPPAAGAAAVVARGNCSFAEKIWALQKAGWGAMLLFNNEEECVFMSAPLNETEGLTLAVASLTAEAGAALQALLAEHPSAGQLTVTLRIPKPGPIEWSSVGLWLIATGTVAAGSLWAGHGHWAGLSREGSAPSEKKGPEQPSITIGMHGAVGFVVAASAMLLLLFFFLNKWLAYLMVGLFAIGAWQAVSMVLFSLMQRCCSPQLRAAHVRLPVLGVLPLNGVLAVTTAGVLCATWAVQFNATWSWPLQDIMGVCFMLVILKQFYLPNLKVASILLCLAFVYDVWWVFLQPLVTGGSSVMVEVATGGSSHQQLPMVLRIPQASLGSNPAFAILGLGDVVLPGLLAVFCRRFDISHRLPTRRGYFLPCLVGYGVGLLATYAALWFSLFGDQGQPALLYLVPCTLGTVSALGCVRGEFPALWDNDFEGAGAAEEQRAEDEAAREAAALEGGLEATLLPAGRFTGPAASPSSSTARLLPPSPFDRNRSGSREDEPRG